MPAYGFPRIYRDLPQRPVRRQRIPLVPSLHLSWTFHASAGQNASGASNTITVANTVSIGDLVVVLGKFEGATATATCSDGTSALTAWGPGVTAGARGSEPWLCAFYKLVSDATGTPTYTITFGASATRSWRDIVVMSWTPSAGTVSLDGTAVANSGGPAVTLNTSDIITVGSDGVAFGLYAEFGDGLSATTINGVASDQFKAANAANSAMWAKTYAAGYTGHASATTGGGNVWTAGIIAFKNASAAINPSTLNNYQFVKVGSGMSTSEKIK